MHLFSVNSNPNLFIHFSIHFIYVLHKDTLTLWQRCPHFMRTAIGLNLRSTLFLTQVQCSHFNFVQDRDCNVYHCCDRIDPWWTVTESMKNCDRWLLCDGWPMKWVGWGGVWFALSWFGGGITLSYKYSKYEPLHIYTSCMYLYS